MSSRQHAREFKVERQPERKGQVRDSIGRGLVWALAAWGTGVLAWAVAGTSVMFARYFSSTPSPAWPDVPEMVLGSLFMHFVVAGFATILLVPAYAALRVAHERLVPPAGGAQQLRSLARAVLLSLPAAVGLAFMSPTGAAYGYALPGGALGALPITLGACSIGLWVASRLTDPAPG